MHTMSLLPTYNVQAKFEFYKDEESLAKNWKQSAKCNTNQTTFLEGILLKSLDREALYTYVDYSVFYGGVKGVGGVSMPKVNSHSNEVLRVQNHRYSTEIPPERIREKGFYDELECILRDGVTQLPRTPVSKDSVYFLTAFHTFEETPSLEKLWRTWSGANFILWNCPKDLKLRRVTFFKTTTRLDTYSYLTLCECEDGMNYLNNAQDFSELLKTRRCGVVGLYKVERYYIPPQRTSSH